MNYYEISTPRTPFALAALAMTALTIGVLVVMPSRMEADSQAYDMLARRAAASCTTAIPANCIEVGVRDSTAANAVSPPAERRCDAQG